MPRRPKTLSISRSTYYRMKAPRPTIVKKTRGGKTFVVGERRSGGERRKFKARTYWTENGVRPARVLVAVPNPRFKRGFQEGYQQRSGKDRRKKQ